MRGSIKDQLNSLVKDRTKNQGIKIVTPSPKNWKEDGIDHINIYSKAGTELGKFLSNNTKTPFRHRIFGKFKCVDGFWWYITSVERDDYIRGLDGYQLQNFKRKLTLRNVKNFKAMVIDTIWQKIKQHQSYAKLLKESDLPLDCYSINDYGVLHRPTYYRWLLSGLEELRTALKENREPDLTFLLDVKGSNIYDYWNQDVTTE
jgi:hypothetical protein